MYIFINFSSSFYKSSHIVLDYQLFEKFKILSSLDQIRRKISRLISFTPFDLIFIIPHSNLYFFILNIIDNSFITIMKNESCYKYLHLFNDSLVLKIQLMQIPSLYRLHLIKINANILLQIYMLFCRYFSFIILMYLSLKIPFTFP